MRRASLIAIGALLLVLVAVVAVVLISDDDDAYYVRAIFDNASTVVPGEDVKISGVPVGVVTDMNVTEDKRAAVTLRVDARGFTPFKRNARCQIGAQGLIGEKYVECEPGTADAEPLPRIEEGDGEGEHLLPVANTSSPVDLDLINDIMRLPYRERFSILLSEFGTGLAGRGNELNEVIHRANPALRETSEVIEILARQNRELAALARDSDAALAPLARERESLAGFVVEANETAQATAERRQELSRSIELLPEFLAELEPLMLDLERLADQGTPLLTDLRAAGPALGRMIRAQGTLATAGRESFPSLGDALERGRPALLRARPLIQDLNRLGKQLAPVSVDLDDLLRSLDRTGGVERFNDLLYYAALSVNGFDEFGHYLRAGLVTNLCSTYAITHFPACNANFNVNTASTADVSAANATTTKLDQGGSVPSDELMLNELLGNGSDPELARQREDNLETLRERARGGSPALEGVGDPMLDYLLGGESP